MADQALIDAFDNFERLMTLARRAQRPYRRLLDARARRISRMRTPIITWRKLDSIPAVITKEA